MRAHSGIGEKIVALLDGLAHLAPAVRADHERWDGRGYPDGLKGHEIPIASRIVLACDAYDAMTTDRPYRRAMGTQEARMQLLANAGTQFDPRVAQALLAVIELRQDVTGPAYPQAPAHAPAEPAELRVARCVVWERRGRHF